MPVLNSILIPISGAPPDEADPGVPDPERDREECDPEEVGTVTEMLLRVLCPLLKNPDDVFSANGGCGNKAAESPWKVAPPAEDAVGDEASETEFLFGNTGELALEVESLLFLDDPPPVPAVVMVLVVAAAAAAAAAAAVEAIAGVAEKDLWGKTGDAG